jgi:tetratricopeptide (TPR) repeat protein
MKKVYKERAAVLFAGVILAFLVLEAGLRIFGSFYEKNARQPADPGSGITVLCVGDSFTVGLGAPEDKSFPSQLQSLLNAKRPDLSFRVVNRGVVIQNSSQLLSALQANIEAVRPEVVVVMTGLANGWNFQGLHAAAGNRGVFAQVAEYLTRSSGVKLYRRLVNDWRDKREKKGGDSCSRDGEFSEAALQCLIKSAASAPADSGVRAEIGFRLLDSGEEAEARTWFEAGVSADAKDPLNYAGMGLALMTAGEPGAAAKWFLREIASARNNASASFRLGTALKLAGDLKQAREWHLKGIALDPSYGLNYSALCWLSLGQKDYPAARQWLAKALGENVKGVSARREDRYALAADLGALAARVVAAGPGHAGESGRSLLDYTRPEDKTEGMSLYAAGRYPQAMAWFERRLKEKPSDSAAACGKGMVLLTLGRPGQAAEAFLESVRLDPAQTRNYYFLGEMFKSRGRPEEALQWFKEGILAGPADKDKESYPDLAITLIGLRLYDAAEEFFSAAASVNPGLNDVLERVRKGRDVGAEIERWVSKDLESIIALCRKNRVAVVLQNYPTVANNPYWNRLCSLIAGVARKNKVPLVDNYSAFSALGKKDPQGGYFAVDGHCNEKGYFVIAGLVAEAILRVTGRGAQGGK